MSIWDDWSVKVEIAFTTQPHDPTPSWVDVSADVSLSQGIDISRGRSDERSEVQPGQCTLALKNDTGTYSPTNPASPHYGHLKPGRRIRVTLVGPSGFASQRFDGYITGWPISWSKRALASTVVITATDRLAKLGNATALASALTYNFDTTSPLYHWPLSEDVGSPKALEVQGKTALTVRKVGNVDASLQFGSTESILPGGEDRVVKIDRGLDEAGLPTGEAYLGARLPALAFAGASSKALSAELFINLNYVPEISLVGPFAIVLANAASAYPELAIWYQGDQVSAYYNATASTSVAVQAQPPQLNTWQRWCVQITPGGDLTLNIDGEVAATAAGVPTTAVTFNDVAFAGYHSGSSVAVDFSGSIAHAAIHHKTGGLTDAEQLARLAAGRQTPQLADDQIIQLLTWAGQPVSSIATPAPRSKTYIAPQHTLGASAASLISEAITAEYGQVFVDRQGDWQIHNRAKRYNRPLDQIFSVAATDPQASLTLAVDEQQIVNSAAVTAAGVTATAKDQSSIDDYGLYDRSDSISSATAVDAETAAAWIVEQYKNPLPRLQGLEWDLTAKPDHTAAVLALDIGSKIRLTDLPSQLGIATLDLWVEGTSEKIQAHAHTVHVATSPTLPLQDSLWQLNTSALDSDTLLGH